MSAVVEVDSADAWQSVVSSCFVPLACNDVEPGFSGRMEHTQLDDGIAVSLTTSSGHSSIRTARLARGDGGDDLHLSLQRSSTGTISSGSRTVAVRPGSVSVYRVDAPYLVDYSRPNQQQLLVQVSRSSLRLPRGMIGEAADRVALPRVQEAPAARALFSYAADLPDTGEETAEVASVVRDLASVMIHSAFTSAPVTPRTTAGLHHTVRQHLRDHAFDRHLTMDEVARRHGVSRRRLYQVFEPDGISPAAYLRSVRLSAATEMLGAPRQASITEVAYACGFNDPLTFSRAFRRAYGVTPREWRAGRAA